MEAMRLRIIQLEEELAQRESGASQVRTSVKSGYVIAEPPSQTSDARPAKRARVDNEDASASTSTPSAATTSKADAATTKADKADAKKRKMQFNWAVGEFQVHETHRFRAGSPRSSPTHPPISLPQRPTPPQQQFHMIHLFLSSTSLALDGTLAATPSLI